MLPVAELPLAPERQVLDQIELQIVREQRRQRGPDRRHAATSSDGEARARLAPRVIHQGDEPRSEAATSVMRCSVVDIGTWRSALDCVAVAMRDRRAAAVNPPKITERSCMAAGGPEISIVLPAHNEAGNIAPIRGRDRAGDGAARLATRSCSSTTARPTARSRRSARAARDPAIRYVSFTRNFGHQAALRAGLRHARGRAVIVMDADFEHPPELIPKLVAAWRGGAKIVATRRDDERRGRRSSG